MLFFLMGVILFFFIEIFNFKMESKFKNITLKTERIMLGSFFALDCISQIIIAFFVCGISNIGFQSLNAIINLFNLILMYRVIKAKKNREYAFLSISLYSLILPVLYYFNCLNMSNIIIFCFLIISNCIKDLDYYNSFRKKNVLRYLVIGICSFIIGCLKFYLIPIVLWITLYLIFVRMNRVYRNKVIGLVSFIQIVLYISLAFIIKFSNINIFEFIYESTIKNDFYTVINFLYKSIFIALFLECEIHIIYNFIKNGINKNNVIRQIIILYLAVIYLFERRDFNILLTMMLMDIFINHEFLNNLVYLKKYKKTKLVKKVSVVIPNYNYAQYIEERIDTVLKQTYPIYELIILDDKSKDNSIEIIEKKIKEIESKYPNTIIKFLPNEVNSGNVFKQWTKAFEVSSGDYLWIAEADDLSNKHFLNVVMQGFEDNDDVILSYTESLAIDENGTVFKKDLRDWIDIFNSKRWNDDYIVSGKKELSEVLCINNTIANVSSVVFHKNNKCDFKKYLKEAQSFILAGDWYFYTKVLLSGSIAYSKMSYNYHRIHSNSVTNTTDNFIHYNEILRIQEEVKESVEIQSDILEKINKRRELLKRDLGLNEDELYYHKINLDSLITEKKISDEVLLSIIMPVYNTEKYLNKCFKSFIKYLPEKTEVIVINDGSPDDSEKIILDYASKFSCIKYIKKENGGLSSVKNVGLREAKGRYITFIDSDDYVSSNMYSTMLKKAIDKDLDMIYCDVLMVYENSKKLEYRNMTNYNREENDILRHIDSGLMAASWNKLVKRELYSGIEFPEGMNNEDVAVSPILFHNSKKISKVESPFYKYVQRSGSIQNSGFNEKRFVIFNSVNLLFERIKEFEEEEKKKIQGAIVTHQLIAILMFLIAPIEEDEQRKKFIKIFCTEYNKLDLIENNIYITEFLEKYQIQDLDKMIEEEQIENIDTFLKRKYQTYTHL